MTAMTPITTVIRFLIPIAAVLIVLEVLYVLLKNRKKPEPMAFFRPGNGGADIEILFFENSIGRSKVNDIVLLDPSASRFHAVLSLRERGWIITDTESKSGVYVNDVRVEGRALIRHNDLLRMGKSTMIFLERSRRQ